MRGSWFSTSRGSPSSSPFVGQLEISASLFPVALGRSVAIIALQYSVASSEDAMTK
jgi:hypothetical protein